MLRMPVAKARRHQHLDGVAEQLRARVAEEPFGLRVDQDHAPFLIHQHHRVGRGLEQPAERLELLSLSSARLRSVMSRMALETSARPRFRSGSG